MARAAEFDAAANGMARLIFQDAPPTPVLVSACRGCPFFDDRCLGAGIAHTVLEIPGLHHKKLKRLSEEGIIDLSRLPDDLELNENQQRARDAALSGTPIIDSRLGKALATIAYPCHYLDFETVSTVLPLYKGHGCNQQVLTQFSVHRCETIGGAAILQGYRVRYRETHVLLDDLADAVAEDTRKEFMESLTTVPLLIIDDFGMRKLPLTAAEDLLEMIMRRYERASTLLTSNRPVEDWGKLLSDVAAVSAMLDRILHHGHVLKCGPRSWRTKAATGGAQ
jgi:hypothetical protein